MISKKDFSVNEQCIFWKNCRKYEKNIEISSLLQPKQEGII